MALDNAAAAEMSPGGGGASTVHRRLARSSNRKSRWQTSEPKRGGAAATSSRAVRGRRGATSEGTDPLPEIEDSEVWVAPPLVGIVWWTADGTSFSTSICKAAVDQDPAVYYSMQQNGLVKNGIFFPLSLVDIALLLREARDILFKLAIPKKRTRVKLTFTVSELLRVSPHLFLRTPMRILANPATSPRVLVEISLLVQCAAPSLPVSRQNAAATVRCRAPVGIPIPPVYPRRLVHHHGWRR